MRNPFTHDPLGERVALFAAYSTLSGSALYPLEMMPSVRGKRTPYLRTMSAKPHPVLARRIFWDVDFDKLDYEMDARLIIERVFAWGDVPDLRSLRRHYGDDRILEVLLVSDNMPSLPLHLAAAVFGREVSEFESAAKAEGRDPYKMKREYFVRLHEIHGLPPFPEPDPILMRMG